LETVGNVSPAERKINRVIGARKRGIPAFPLPALGKIDLVALNFLDY
jgi:hypothetical protein